MRYERRRDVEHASSHGERTGDILGLGSGPVPKPPDDPSTEYDPEAVTKRRVRVRSEDDEGPSRSTPGWTAGATNGNGDAGTDVTRD